MFVSVIVPMYNAERYLAVCLDGLVSQDYPSSDYEILLVDNQSTDRSVEIGRRYQRVTLLSEPAPGAYLARNLGIKAARGEILAFTDPDCGRRLPARRSFLLASIGDYENTKDRFVMEADDPELYYGYTSNMAVRRYLFDRLGLFLDLPRGADALFVRQVAEERSCARIRYLASAVVTHLELDRVSVYYKKVFLYGRHRRRANSILRTRPLNLVERMEIYRRTVTAGRYSLVQSAFLLGALGLGSLAWFVGSATAQAGRATASGHSTGAPNVR
jgi:glycosyltransferase involved in cell wall biosynthesis